MWLGGGVGAQVGMVTLAQLSSVTDNINVIINTNTNRQTNRQIPQERLSESDKLAVVCRGEREGNIYRHRMS